MATRAASPCMTLHLPEISYVAVPKTATIAIENAFAPFASGYSPHVHQAVDVVKAAGGNACLGVIRNPRDWIKSYYLYLKHSPYFHSADSAWGIASKSFEQFVGRFCDGQWLWPEPLRFQSNYLCANGVHTDYLYRYENISDAIDHLSAACGQRPRVERHNVSPKSDVTMSDEMASRFEQYSAVDFELYENCRTHSAKQSEVIEC